MTMGAGDGGLPTGAPWDLSMQNAPFAFVDLEMTGLDLKMDRVVEVCIERVRGGVVESRLSSLINPEGEFTGPSMAIHGIEAPALREAPPFRDLFPAIKEILAGAVFVAHGARSDVTFLNAEATRMSETLTLAHYLDTLNLSRRCFLLPSHAMSALCTHLGIVQSAAHRAEDDVTSLRRVFEHVVLALGPKSPRDLWDVRIKERHARETILHDAHAYVASGAVACVAYRPSRKKPVVLRMRITNVKTTEGLVIGHDVVNFSRYELRAERILRMDADGAMDPGRGIG